MNSLQTGPLMRLLADLQDAGFWADYKEDRGEPSVRVWDPNDVTEVGCEVFYSPGLEEWTVERWNDDDELFSRRDRYAGQDFDASIIDHILNGGMA